MFKANEFNALLAKHGITKEQMAKELSINPSTFHRKLNNGANFSYHELLAMANILGKSDVINVFF